METTDKTNVSEGHAPRKMTLAENVKLTIKVLGVTALILGALWGANLWTGVK